MPKAEELARLDAMVSTPNVFASVQVSEMLSAATEGLPAPISVVDLEAFDANARQLAVRSHGKPIRLATKSLRNRELIDRALAAPAFKGLMAYSLREALWLVGLGYKDILVAYPTVDREAILQLAHDEEALREIVLIVDNVAHVELFQAARPILPVRIALDVDSSLRVFEGARNPIHIGVRRSPIHSVADVGTFLDSIQGKTGVTLIGAMFYDAQIAGMPDKSWVLRTMKKVSRAELANRRVEIIEAMTARLGPLELVNAGGTGSVGDFERATEVTEVTAGSGLYAPALFDGYRDLGARPAAYYGLDVVRHPRPGIFTAFSGGYVASGTVDASRHPKPIDTRYRTLSNEGVGEVQTPLRATKGARVLEIGERVWLRHSKAGEQMERFNLTYLLHDNKIVAESPTYRGEGKNFG